MNTSSWVWENVSIAIAYEATYQVFFFSTGTGMLLPRNSWLTQGMIKGLTQAFREMLEKEVVSDTN